MNTTSNTMTPAEERTGGGDADDPGSAGERDHPPQPSGSMPPSIDCAIVSEGAEAHAGLDETWLRENFLRALGHLDARVARVTLSIVDDARMARLHRRHCDIDATTDVLTFPMSDPGAPIEADIAICADVAARRAAERGHDLNHELLLYALHGVLHCAGHDDHDDEAYRVMHAEEDRILRAIGVGAVFDTGEGDLEGDGS